MADYNSNYTGQQIDNAVAKATKLPTTSSGDSRKTIQVDSSGNFVVNSVSGGTQLYKHSLVILTQQDEYSLTIFSTSSNTIVNYQTLLATPLIGPFEIVIADMQNNMVYGYTGIGYQLNRTTFVFQIVCYDFDNDSTFSIGLDSTITVVSDTVTPL